MVFPELTSATLFPAEPEEWGYEMEENMSCLHHRQRPSGWIRRGDCSHREQVQPDKKK